MSSFTTSQQNVRYVCSLIFSNRPVQNDLVVRLNGRACDGFRCLYKKTEIPEKKNESLS